MPRKRKPSGKEFWDDPSDVRHGTPNGYSNLGCRCERCRKAATQAHYRYMHADPERLKKHADRRMAAYRSERSISVKRIDDE